MTTRFRVVGVFPVSFWPDPFLIGIPDGEVNIGDEAQLCRANEAPHHGIVKRVEFHRPTPDQLSISISGSLAKEVKEGDIILIGDEDITNDHGSH
ncbi:hypothetical protein ACFWPK_32205 [Nocardia sp. NPDC058519]|uniref:hypothetical protein n=1 Tax=Nocardia sp. NPDC058519 TaxID=3346535 RepID=UPI00364790F3